MFAATKEKGQALGEPDICKTPAPPAPNPVPVPYPNMAPMPLAEPGAENVFICGMPAINKASSIEPTQGDEPGVEGGMESNEIMGPAKFTAGSEAVTIEGSPAERLGMPTTHNNNNTVGTISVPSQEVVLIMR